MRIVNNIMAMNAHRQLMINQGGVAKSIERLSSGLRINRAGDDAAGLAISEKMRAQIRGLNQAMRNAQDGISLIQTAEGALSETHAILQRMRELAVQAANSTNTEIDRSEIQKEINQLTSEINRIGNTTEFNTLTLLAGVSDGAVVQEAVQIDPTELVDEPTNLAGGLTNDPVQAEVTVEFKDTAANSHAGKNVTFTFGGQTFEITFKHEANLGQGEEYLEDVTGTSATVVLKEAEAKGADVAKIVAQALEEMIAANADLADTDFEVSVDGAEVTVAATADGKFAGEFGSIIATPDAANIINNVGANVSVINVGVGVTYDHATAEIDFSSIKNADDVAELLGKGLTINGQTIEFYNANEGVYTGDAQFAVNLSDATDGAGVVAAIAAQLGTALDGVTLSAGGVNDDQLVITAAEGGEAGNDITFSDGVDIPEVTEERGPFAATLQIGANEGQSFTITIADMRAAALGLSAAEGTEGFTGGLTVTDGTSNELQESALDVSSHESAANAIIQIDNAIEQVSSQRSDLGAFQNRLEHTINNLGTSAENLQAAESRIRDIDMAAEMMQFTKFQILQQASTAMLAQANLAPQSVLQLLG